MSLQAYARALGGEVSAGRILAPGPNHSRKDRSLSVAFDTRYPDGFLVHSHAGDDPITCKDHVRDLLRLPAYQGSREALAPAPRPEPRKSDDDRTDQALALWAESCPPAGTPVDRYLSSRGIKFPAPRAFDWLRWHPSCPFGQSRVGCMVVLVRDIVTNQPRAIHRTAVDAEGRKRKDLGSNGRLTLGPVSGGAVKITPDEDVSTGLAIGEGLESCLSVRNLPGMESMAVWALLSAGQVARFPALSGIESLWIVVDHDDAGVRASRSAFRCWHDAGREVVAITPTKVKSDLNDIAREAIDA